MKEALFVLFVQQVNFVLQAPQSLLNVLLVHIVLQVASCQLNVQKGRSELQLVQLAFPTVLHLNKLEMTAAK